MAGEDPALLRAGPSAQNLTLSSYFPQLQKDGELCVCVCVCYLAHVLALVTLGKSPSLSGSISSLVRQEVRVIS